MGRLSLDLTGPWQFKEYPLSVRRMRDLDAAGWHTTSIPSSIFTSLIEAGLISQNEIDTNPENFTWVSEKPWVFRKTFDAPPELLACDRIDLVFDGLDTIAAVWLNEKLIARTNNMFIPFRFDVTNLLRPQNNSLLVKFDPAVAHAERLMNRYGRLDDTGFSNPARVYIRKAQYQFGWDFCPPLPGCGIWRPVRLEGITKARIADLHIRTVDCSDRSADIRVALRLDRLTSEKLTCSLTLSGNGPGLEHDLVFDPAEDSQSTLIHVENPALWWPSGRGPQHLYQLDARLLAADDLVDAAGRTFGIRTARLVKAPDSTGQKFCFEVNGRRILVRGANWAPASIFAGAVAPKDYEHLLNAVKDANMNMLRVWGGGYYESETFYELCDRLGILLWQDFMFACAYYPDRRWFLDEVRKEAAAVIERLRNHPSLVLWCGNNEIDWLHSIGRLGSGRKFYGKAIYHRLLPNLVAELDPDADYIPTTPLPHRGQFDAGNALTTHQWDVWSNHRPTTDYLYPPEQIPPFVTEFGLQSLPSLTTLKSFCPPNELRVGGRTLEKHNYQVDGNARLYRYLGDLFGPAEDISRFAYLSQLTQARAVKMHVEHLRAHRRDNSGVLFWQLEDCCPAISWSAIDCAKEPKALYYYARRFFAKLLVTAVTELAPPRNGVPPQWRSLRVIAINDAEQPLTATLNCRLIDLYGATLDKIAVPVALGPFGASAPLMLPKAFVLPQYPEKSALHLLLEQEGRIVAENLLLYLPDKHIDWPEPDIRTSLSPLNDGRWRLKLHSKTVAKDVCVQYDDPEIRPKLSDNFVDLTPPETRVLEIDCDPRRSLVESLLRLQCAGRPRRRAGD